MENIKISDHFTYKKLLLYAFPTIGMILIAITYDVVDGYYISNYIGKTAFSAVNVVYPFQLALSMVGYMFGTGGSALIAAELGRGNKQRANAYFTMIIKVAIVMGVILAVIGIAFLPAVATALGATPGILKYGVPYGRTLFLFLPIMICGYAFQELLVTAEKPMIGLYLSIANLLSNVILDYLFVVVFRWGMIGAAVATGIGASITGLVPLIYFSRDNSSLLRFVRDKIYWKALLDTCYNGASEMINDMATSVIFVLYNYQLLRMIGENGVAAYGVTVFVEGIFSSVYIGLAMEATAVVGYHFGAENKRELKSLLKKGIILNLVSGVIMFVLCWLFAGLIAGIYVGYDKEVCNLAVYAMRLYAFTFLLQGFNEYASAYFTGLNNGKVSAFLAFSRTLVFQVLAILGLPLVFGVNGLWLATPAAEAAAFVLSALSLLSIRWE